MSCTQFARCRPHDFYYDPLFIVSSKKDHLKAANKSKKRTAKYAVCPVFENMFSELPQYPRMQYLMRRSSIIPQKFKETQSHESNIDEKEEVVGANRYKYFQTPVGNGKSKDSPEYIIYTTRKSKNLEGKYEEHFQSKQTQTKYRESSAQTHPWEPDYKLMEEGDPEILKLDFLKWGQGLPAGMHEVQLIERARMKRLWQERMPKITGLKSIEEQRLIIDAIEQDEWAFRDREIQDIQDLRLELLENMLNEMLQVSANRAERRLQSLIRIKQAEKEEKVRKLRRDAERKIRKLDMANMGVNAKYRKVGIAEEFGDPSSEMYLPLMRHGSHPKRWHMVINMKSKNNFVPTLNDIEELKTLPNWINEVATQKTSTCDKMSGTRLCIRETKWTAPVLKQLYDDLKNLRKSTKQVCHLRERIIYPEALPDTPEIEGDDDDEENLAQAVTKLQSILRGRATQILIYEGRERCRELIDELKTTTTVLEEEKIIKFQERVEVKNQQRDQEVCLKNARKIHEILSRLQGTVVGTLLDFLNKELHKLMEERRIHAMCLLAERERHRREAAEAGRRQKEIRRRKEHDEMFKQVVKIHQETVDMYLQDIITEGMEFASTEDAKQYVLALAEKVDEEVSKPIGSFHEGEELVADLVHHFVLPEVEKQLCRERTKMRQKRHLKATHEAVYKTIEDLPKPPPRPIIYKRSKKAIDVQYPSMADEYILRYFQDVDLDEGEQQDDYQYDYLPAKSSDNRLVPSVASSIEPYFEAFKHSKTELIEREMEQPPDHVSTGASSGKKTSYDDSRSREDRKHKHKTDSPTTDSDQEPQKVPKWKTMLQKKPPKIIVEGDTKGKKKIQFE